MREKINKADLLDPASLSGRSEKEKQVIADAERVGNNSAPRNHGDTGGIPRQIIDSECHQGRRSGKRRAAVLIFPAGSRILTKQPGGWSTKMSITVKNLSKGVVI